MAKTPYRDSLLLRQMGTHGILMAKFENSKAVSIKTGRVLPLSELQARLAHRLDILGSSKSDSRHASVRRAVLDSVALLTPKKRRFFGLLSHLRNGFTLNDVESILGNHLSEPVTKVARIQAHYAANLLTVGNRSTGTREGPSRRAH